MAGEEKVRIYRLAIFSDPCGCETKWWTDETTGKHYEAFFPCKEHIDPSTELGHLPPLDEPYILYYTDQPDTLMAVLRGAPDTHNVVTLIRKGEVVEGFEEQLREKGFPEDVIEYLKEFVKEYTNPYEHVAQLKTMANELYQESLKFYETVQKRHVDANKLIEVIDVVEAALKVLNDALELDTVDYDNV